MKRVKRVCLKTGVSIKTALRKPALTYCIWCVRSCMPAVCRDCARNYPRISRAYAHILAFFSTDVKRRQSLYDEDSLDGDHPSENEGITFFKGSVETDFRLFTLFIVRFDKYFFTLKRIER